jgi:sterol desaturase/sphingolipid hydroxylase (fatty acid hydroxylase superfamily)
MGWSTMFEALTAFLTSTVQSVRVALELLVLSGLVFALMALVFKGPHAIEAGRRALAEVWLNLRFYAFDILTISPLVGLVVAALRHAVDESGLTLLSAEAWSPLGTYGTFFAAVFLADFIGYWRHRLEHTRWLWPAHAIHHGDTEMTWTTLARFHPVNRLSTAIIDIAGLAVLGFPTWALIANEIVRNYWGQFIHADFPWTFGPAGKAIVSPAMHRWHHARDVVGAGSNFATVFSVFDRAFGTFHVPGPCTVALGVTDDVGRTLIQQLAFPFTAWLRRLRGQDAEPDATSSLGPPRPPG